MKVTSADPNCRMNFARIEPSFLWHPARVQDSLRREDTDPDVMIAKLVVHSLARG